MNPLPFPDSHDADWERKLDRIAHLTNVVADRLRWLRTTRVARATSDDMSILRAHQEHLGAVLRRSEVALTVGHFDFALRELASVDALTCRLDRLMGGGA